MSQHGQSSGRRWVAVGTLLGFFGVFAGAFGAHGLKDSGFLTRKYGDETKEIAGHTVPAAYKYLGDFEVGVRYQMYHALALIALGLFVRRHPSTVASASGWCFTIGTVLFSGALYVLVVGGPKYLGVPWGMVAPVGGTLQLVGWATFAVCAIQGTGRTKYSQTSSSSRS